MAARKPVQSFAAAGAAAGVATDATDAHVLAEASGETPFDVCPPHRWYALAMAPPIAAAALGRPPFCLADLLGELAWPAPAAGVGLVETVGGPRSPLADDADSAALVAALRPDAAVLVADAGLGAINAVLLALTALEALGPPPVVFLNRFDPADAVHATNREWLRERGGAVVAVDVAVLAAACGPAPRGDLHP